jgi:hypothetical protein
LIGNYSPETGSNFRVSYRALTRAPSVTQLQDVIDNTNPLQLSGGNPDLRQTITHMLSGSMTETEAEKGTSRMLMLSLSMTKDHIANTIRTIANDTVLAGGILAYRGAQITTPSNLQGYWNARASVILAFPFERLASNVNLSPSASMTRSPGRMNDADYTTTSWTLGSGVALGTNVSRDIDGFISYNGSYTTIRNTLYPDARTSYFTHSASLRSTLTFWEFIVLRNDASYALRTGLSDAARQWSLLWTAALGVKFTELW